VKRGKASVLPRFWGYELAREQNRPAKKKKEKGSGEKEKGMMVWF